MAILTTPSPLELTRFLARYGIAAACSSRALEEGTVNSSFRLEPPGQKPLFLRIYEEQDAAGARREAAMLAHLASRGVRTPSPVPALDRTLVGELCGKPAAIFPWVDGRMRCQAGVTPDDTRRVGAALGRLHRAGEGAERVVGRFERADLHVRLDAIAKAPQPELAALAAPLREKLDAWHAARDAGLPRGLVHGDLFRDNVLWDDRGEISALLDFESACEGTFAYDLMVTILAWCYASDFDPRLVRPLVEGYLTERDLSERERAALQAEGCCAALRFSITRITDRAMRGLTGRKDHRRFVRRFQILEQLAVGGVRELLGV